MQTWVLILMVWGISWDKKPNLTSVPGYSTIGNCRDAGAKLVADDTSERSRTNGPPVTIEYRCFPGPK